MLAQRIVFTLLSHVEVNGVVVGGKLVALEKLNRCLVELQHDNFVEQVEALDVFLVRDYTVGQLGDARDLGILAHEEGAEGVLAFFKVL